MARPPEEIRGEIDDVREDLGETLEEIGDRVAPQKVMARAKAEATEKVEGVKQTLSPRRLARRGTDSVRRGVRRAVGSGADDDGDDGGGQLSQTAGAARERTRSAVGGTKATAGKQARGVAQRAGSAASSVTDSLGDAPQAVRQRAEGNPLAAGLLAFAGGFFAAALLPPTERERQLTEKAKEGLQPLARSAAEVGKSVAGELQITAQASLEAVKETATEAAEEVKGRAQSSAGRVKGEASSATETVAGRAKKATKKVQKEAKGAAGAVKGQTNKAAKKATSGAKKAAPTPRSTPMRPRPSASRAAAGSRRPR